MKQRIDQVLQQHIAQAVGGIYDLELTAGQIKVEHPAEEEKGDYASSVALMLAGRVKEKPMEIAAKIKEELDPPSSRYSSGLRRAREGLEEIIDAIDVVAPGFLNFRIKPSHLLTTAKGIVAALSEPLADTWQGKKIMVEFAHPNTHKEFHIGHLRNIAIGESLVRLLEANGATVFRANYEGDVGLHVAKAIWGIYQQVGSGPDALVSLQKTIAALTPAQKAEFLGQGYALGSKRYDEEEQAKQEIITLNKRIYHDPGSVLLWNETRKMSLEYFDTIYARLYTHFDRFFFESDVAAKGRQLVVEGVDKHIFVRDNDGSIYFPGEKVGLNNCVFVTREDYATYEAKDLAVEDLEYQTFPYDQNIHVVANEQTNFFQIAFAALEQVFPYQKGKQFHLAYGMVKMKSGKISSRTGDVVTAEELIDQAKEKIGEIRAASKERSGIPSQDDVAEKVAVAAVKYAMLRVNPKQDISFDLESSISLDGDSGPYLLYTYARCQSVLRKAGHSDEHSDEESRRDPSLSLRMTDLNDEESQLLRFMIRFPEAVAGAGAAYSPSIIATYVFDLAQRYNIFYNKHTILGDADTQIKQRRLFLTDTTAALLKRGLFLLGIETVERM